MSNIAGKLYIVATPIGNLGDFSPRAQQVLQDADLIAAEDTRHTNTLLRQFSIDTSVFSLHEHNESQKYMRVIDRLQSGQDIALVSDAGTPLISDPGYMLVKACHQQGIQVVPIPGASALITALSASGLATDRFLFEGFLPRTSAKRISTFQSLKNFSSTLVFYESSHRILESLRDMQTVFGGERRVVLARELTKQFETLVNLPLDELIKLVAQDSNQQRGEFVVLVEGCTDATEDTSIEKDRLLEILSGELAPNKAAKVAAKITGLPKRQLYELLMGKK